MIVIEVVLRASDELLLALRDLAGAIRGGSVLRDLDRTPEKQMPCPEVPPAATTTTKKATHRSGTFSPFQRGRRAYRRGEPIRAVPANMSLKDHEEYREGWKDAQSRYETPLPAAPLGGDTGETAAGAVPSVPTVPAAPTDNEVIP